MQRCTGSWFALAFMPPLGIETLMDRRVMDFSDAELRKVALALCLANVTR